MKSTTVFDDIDLLFDVLPLSITSKITKIDDLIEIVIDLGRDIQLRYDQDYSEYIDVFVTEKLISDIVANIGQPGIDNRCGIDSTLHRISVLVDKNERIVGMTIRLGKPYVGNAILIDDLLAEKKSILIVGPPSTGKTSLLREAARIMSCTYNRRVVIVDTSNEIAGEGSVPHLAVGTSRRLQVPRRKAQHEVMIEAVENHNPQVIIVDEVSTVDEASAVQTIARRGVEILATAHGNTLDDVIKNKQLTYMLGGIKTVTLSDDVARMRGTQKTVQEREQEPSFDCVVEIRAYDEIAVHSDITKTVDALLNGRAVQPEVRRLIDDKVIIIQRGKIEDPKRHIDVEETETRSRTYRETKSERKIKIREQLERPPRNNRRR